MTMMTNRRRPPGGNGSRKLDKLRDLLLDGDWHTTTELVEEIGHTFHVPLFILRHVERHKVECTREPGERWLRRYRLADGPSGRLVPERPRRSLRTRVAQGLRRVTGSPLPRPSSA